MLEISTVIEECQPRVSMLFIFSWVVVAYILYLVFVPSFVNNLNNTCLEHFVLVFTKMLYDFNLRKILPYFHYFHFTFSHVYFDMVYS